MTRSTSPADFSARSGLPTIGPETLRLWTELEARFLRWAAEFDAMPVRYPPLLSTADLDSLDYFENFPQLAVLGSRIRGDAAAKYARAGLPGPEVDAADLEPAGFALPSAACYSVYLDLRGTRLAESRRVTTVATCFRHETHYDGLRRLLGFTMREIVCVGAQADVLDHLARSRQAVTGFLSELGLPIEVRPATDPFFDRDGARSVMQRLFPVKEEFVFGDDLAIGSINFHRNFFGERLDIRQAGGDHAFTGCLAFGVERWISALTTHFGETPAQLVARIQAASR
ncbi:aminoacyl--tRNA ligase-related protein [Lentzea californiensis]|uniref:aminoacyl--tRNA ligase-related protein n=1 Tax=Lentzea californiensis TaxID=438851 RepID=UPI002165E40D|nr:aminoacyl--tRNA ligase-related protein [Lentzea californiensis]MCR3752108.1 tRNA synthetase class II core domain (G, H, P, S and T) [Lentzea californiensis]